MHAAQKGSRGRKRGSGRFGVRTTVSLTTEMMESLQTLAREKNRSQAQAIREILGKGLEASGLDTNQVVVTLASGDMDDLKRAVKYGRVSSLEFAVVEAVRTYLKEWLPTYLQTKEKTL